MKKMVVGFAFDKELLQVLLIEKRRPEWQKGKYNGIGGHVEKGEPFLDAINREFKEEAGLSNLPWEHFVTIMAANRDYKIYFYRCFTKKIYKAITQTDEITKIFHIGCLPNNIMPNLKWLIPLALDKSGVQFPIEIEDVFTNSLK